MRVNVGSFGRFGEDIPVTYDTTVSFGPPEATVSQTGAASGSSFWDSVGSALTPVIQAAGRAAAVSIYNPRPGQPGYVPPPKAPVTGSVSLGGISPNLLILGGVGLFAAFMLLRRRR